MSDREVLYSCGQCRYPLKLCSSDRATVGVGANYYKENRSGKICFLDYDVTRFTPQDELKCGLFYHKTSWSLHRLRTNLYCRQCEALIGYVYDDGMNPLAGCSGYERDSDGASYGQKRFWVKIRALQPEEEIDDGYSPSKTDGKDLD